MIHPSSPRWKEIAPSQFPWEREALQFVRDRLPDHEPYRVWSNFEFIADDGSINEVDLLVLSPKGFFLVEIKSGPGVVTGDAGTWTWVRDGSQSSHDSPLLLANRKAKRLASLLRRQKACEKVRTPFLEPLVFLSHEAVRCELDQSLRRSVHVRDRDGSDGQPKGDGIISAMTHISPEDWNDPRRMRPDKPIAKAISRAMEEAGVRPSQRARQVGDYRLEALIFEGPNYQDWSAVHVSLKNVTRRIRLYPIARAASDSARQTLVRAARREFEILEGIHHPGILRAVDYREHEIGPALVFEHHPDALRLDHYLLQHAQRLDADLRLTLLRQIAEAVQYAHEKRLVHRALGPQSILVHAADSRAPRTQIFNWQTGAREIGSTSTEGLNRTLTSHLADLVEDAATVYMAPESLSDPTSSGENLDVFSLGALAYHLFSGAPPASSFFELCERVREGKGLQIARVVDGASKELGFLIAASTHPEVSSRLDSVSDFLECLDAVEEELTAPEKEPPKNPTDASINDELSGGIFVKKRLGKGSTAVVFLVERAGREHVLKLALDPDHNERLQAEAEVLRRLRHQAIVELHDVVEIAGHTGLLMAKAGDQTLAQRLRSEGRLHVDLLQRFGEDLLQALQFLEEQGVPHRDIKPDNLGVAEVGRGDTLHLVLFDFSLARAPAENIRAGTVPYLEPFLSQRKPPRWDLYAERFSAALTLYEMATGTLPKWGDGKSDPSVLDCEATVESDLFDPELRESLESFFLKGLRRDFRQRFDNANEMLGAWRKAFERVDRPAVSSDHADATHPGLDLASAELNTPVAALGLSTRATNALERVNALTVRDLLRLPVSRISHMRGVGNKTRRELVELLSQLGTRFPGTEKDADGGPGVDDGAEPPVSSIDLLAKQLIASPARSRATAERSALELLLGLGASTRVSASVWPSQTEVAARLEVTRARVGQIVAKARERWRRNPSLTSLRDEIAAILRTESGIMSATELATAILTTRGCAQAEPTRSQLAHAVARAATEAERTSAEPRWITRRDGDRVLLALDDVDGAALADYAEQLGRVADRLATADPLPSSARVIEELQAVRTPSGVAALPAQRLLRLAAAASEGAAVSGRLELYPRGMPAERAVKLSQGGLLGSRELSVAEVRERVLSRYPEAAPLPGRPELDSLLASAGLTLEWDPAAGAGRGKYVAEHRDPGSLSAGSTSLARRPTAVAPGLETSPEIAAARQLEERLKRCAREGAFLVLGVAPRFLEDAERELTRRFEVDARSLEETLIRHMKDEAVRNEVDWSLVLRADAADPKSPDWTNLTVLARRAVEASEREILASSRTVLLTRPGMLARYDQVDLLEHLRDQVGRPQAASGHRFHGAWVLIPDDGQSALPVLDGMPVPVLGPSQFARIPQSWLENAHRAQGESP